MSAVWEERAACRTVGPEPFFPEGPGNGHGHEIRAAKAICAGCPVRAECLDHALELEGDRTPVHRAGIWGGTTARERYRIHQQQAA